jgi:hypothetical protein
MDNISKYSETYFTEEQRFKPVWVWAIVILASVLPWIGLFMQVILGYKIGDNPAPDLLIIVFWILFGIGFPLMFYSTRLITIVKEDGIYLRYIPFHFKYKIYHFDEIEKFEAKKYSPIFEYGGWGIRYGFKGMAYNVYGNMGIDLNLKNKKKVLIGSQKAEEFYEAIVKAINQENQ